ncbi:MAG: glycosyltransferase family 2 protein [Myxococcota bacterium]
MSSPILVAVVTRDRVQALERCITSIRAQTYRGPVRILVVDNDPRRSAESLCKALNVEYIHEEQTGIPFARNRAVAAVEADEDLAFIDDDEQAEPNWLLELARTRDLYDADAVGGPVVSVFDSPPPEWVELSGAFERPRRPTGTVVSAVYTGNILISSRILRELPPPFFCERMALTGGSDGYFAKRLALHGYAMVWCDEAVCYERVPESRVTVAWLLRRSFRIGLNRALIDRELELGFEGYRRTAGRGLLDIAYGTAALAAYGWQGKHQRVRRLRTVVSGLGMLGGLAGFRYDEYRTVHRV